ncbi:MAG: single-stranded-DNA-specific exonuclease RecJ [Chitinispirillaceae bacterium]|nr:single-stranded-DNA-specific exonuclease RecJ [Chitinispirillaceae bacterium]
MNGFTRARERITVREVDAAAAKNLAQALSIPFAAASIMVGRGLSDPGACAVFFNPSLASFHDPFLFPDMGTAVERIAAALAADEAIAVYGDYDVDGISGTVLLVRMLRFLGARVDYHLPHRLTEGYGVSDAGIRQIAASGATLLITVDCGVTSVGEIALARSLGIDCIVTDHHEQKDELPPALAVLDPKLRGCTYPDRDLAGVGVVLKLCQALASKTGRGNALWERFLDLAALGTAADIVPLRGENRIITRFGFKQMSATGNAGLAALIEAQGLDGRKLSTRDVVFQLAPSINAAGRIGDPRRGVELLLTDDAGRAREYARELKTANMERRAIDQAVWAEARAWAEKNCLPERDYAIVAGSANWHAGVIGIVASKLVDRYHRPAILFSMGNDGCARGSGRSITAVPLLDTLAECADLLESFGGHTVAAGMSIKNAAIDDFRNRFNEAVRKRATPDDFVPKIVADTEVSLSGCTPALFSAIKSMEPFGPGNMRPVLYCRNLTHRKTPRIVGEKHVKMAVCGDGLVMDAIAFNFGHRMEELSGAASLSLAFSLDENEWNGRTTLQMNIKGIAV